MAMLAIRSFNFRGNPNQDFTGAKPPSWLDMCVGVLQEKVETTTIQKHREIPCPWNVGDLQHNQGNQEVENSEAARSTLPDSLWLCSPTKRQNVQILPEF